MDCSGRHFAASCGRITRRADGSVISIDSRYDNLSRAISGGTDFTLRGRGESPIGRWRAELRTTFQHKNLLYPFDPGPAPDLEGTQNLNSQTSNPRWLGSASAQLMRGDSRFGVENLTNLDPPRVKLSNSANTDPTVYRLLGRVYTIDVKFTPGSNHAE